MNDHAILSHPYDTARLPAAGTAVTIDAGAGERVALAEAYDLLAVGGLSATVTLTPAGGGMVSVAGRVVADIVQACVVSLEPVPQHIDEPFQMNFVPAEFGGGPGSRAARPGGGDQSGSARSARGDSGHHGRSRRACRRNVRARHRPLSARAGGGIARRRQRYRGIGGGIALCRAARGHADQKMMAAVVHRRVFVWHG